MHMSKGNGCGKGPKGKIGIRKIIIMQRMKVTDENYKS